MRSEIPGMRAEAKTLKRLGFRPTKASGAVAEKGDGRLEFCGDAPGLYIEIKTTEKSSYSLRLEELRKAAREARQDGCRPVFAVTFVSGNGDPRHDGGWVLVPETFIDFPEEGTNE